VQWAIGRQIHSASTPRYRLAWLWISIAFGLGCLGYFKYAGFFVTELNRLLSQFGLNGFDALVSAVAPIGISFYTFQSLTYTIDIYRNREKPAGLRDFSLFVAFFAHVTAGPIARARFLIPQFQVQRTWAGSLEAEAVFLIVRGLIKKIAFADVLAAQFVTPAFSDPSQWSVWFLIVAVLAYSFQIYMDLSGYTDLARGAARCFGYDLPINFDRPYLARTVSNFWQRWHVSMSSFFREYLYWSIGGSKKGNVYLNLLITFVAIGFWHGAGWNFILYGVLHGSVVGLERVHRLSRRRRGLADHDSSFGAHIFGIAYTFMFVAFARILFVESDLRGAWEYVQALWSSPGEGGAAGIQGYATLIAAVLLHFMPENWQSEARTAFFRQARLVQAGLLTALTYGLIALAAEPRAFVYFQF
jgi:D-alanyl-lipoteichoic acid acyltransferase DltB (MBOAT superfamily)